MSTFGVKVVDITSAVRFGEARKGWRLLLPIFAMPRSAYAITHDDEISGWWWLAISIAVEALVFPWHGLGLRLSWGWMPFAGAVRRHEALIARMAPNWGARGP